MLQNIREHVKGWVAGLVIILVGSTFVLFGVEYYVQQSSAKTTVVAEVNGEKITEMEVTQTFHRLQRQEQEAMKGASLTPEQNAQIKQIALSQLINNAAMTQAAHKSGLYVGIDQAKALLLQAPALQVNGQFSNERLQMMIYNSGVTPGQFFSQIQNSILMSQVQAGLQNSEFSLPNEVNTLASLLNQTRSFGYFTIPISQFRSKVKIADAEIKNYYTKNAAQFKTPEKVKLQYVILSPTDLEKSVSVSDQEVKQYYDSNPSNFTSSKRWQINRYLIPLNKDAGSSAVSAAQNEAATLQAKLKNKENTSVKPDLSWISQDQVNGPLANIMSKLQVGDVSIPFRTAEGFNVIQVMKIDAAQHKSFDATKNDIKKALIHQKVQQLLTSKSEQLSNLVYTNPNSLDVAAKSLNLPIQKSDWINRDSGTGIFADPKILEVAFSDEVLNQGNNSTPIELKGGSLMVLRVSDHVKSEAQAFSAVSGKIHDLLADQQAQREAGLQAYQVETELENGAQPSAVAKKYSLSWKSENNILRTNKTLSRELISTAFNLPSDTKKPQAASILMGGKEYAVVLLSSVHTPKAATVSEKERQTLQRNLMVLNAQVLYQLYTKSVMAASKIKVHQTA